MAFDPFHRDLIREAFGEALAGNEAALGMGETAAPFAEYRGDFPRFDREVLGHDTPETELWSMQRKIAEALETKRRVLVATCNGSGKSTFIGRFVPYFMTTRTDARVRLTAGTNAQVMNAHRKVRAEHQLARQPLPGEVMKTAMWELGPEWLYDGVSPDSAETMQGLHSKTGPMGDVPGADGGLLAIIDEASAAEDFKFEAMGGYMTTANTYWLIQGNPNKPDGQFRELWREGGDRWERIQVSAHDVPEHILSRDWIEDQRAYWGEDSPQYRVRVLGEFPEVGGDYMVFPLADFEGAADLLMDNRDGLHLGVDIARGDADLNAMVLQRDRRVEETWTWQSSDLMAVAERVADVIEERGVPARNVHIDTIGLGAGVVDRLRSAGYFVEGVDFGAKPKGDWKDELGRWVRVRNRRAELFWAARHLVREGRASVPREYRRSLWAEASRIQYLPKEEIQIEPKEKVRQRMDGRSPDLTDAWVLGFSRASKGTGVFVG